MREFDALPGVSPVPAVRVAAAAETPVDSALGAFTGPMPAADSIACDPATTFGVPYAHVAALLQTMPEYGPNAVGVLLRRYGEAFATVIAALPTQVREAFIAQLTLAQLAAGGRTRGAASPSKTELAAATAGRLAASIERYGSDAALRLLPPATPDADNALPPILVANALTPPAPDTLDRRKRRHEQPCRRPADERGEHGDAPEYPPDDCTQSSILIA